MLFSFFRLLLTFWGHDHPFPKLNFTRSHQQSLYHCQSMMNLNIVKNNHFFPISITDAHTHWLYDYNEFLLYSSFKLINWTYLLTCLHFNKYVYKIKYWPPMSYSTYPSPFKKTQWQNQLITLFATLLFPIASNHLFLGPPPLLFKINFCKEVLTDKISVINGFIPKRLIHMYIV